MFFEPPGSGYRSVIICMDLDPPYRVRRPEKQWKIRLPLLILLRMAGIHTTYVYLARILRDGCRYGVIQERRSEDDASDILCAVPMEDSTPSNLDCFVTFSDFYF
jgi:hypothetical protein